MQGIFLPVPSRGGLHPLLQRLICGWTKEGGGGQGVGPCVSTRAHEIRACATSLAAKYAFSMRDVLDAAYWRSEDVFISLYLRDVAKSREDGIFGMPAVMAAGGVHFVFSLMVSGVCFEGFFF